MSDDEPTVEQTRVAHGAAVGARHGGAHRLFAAMAGVLLLGLVALGWGVYELNEGNGQLAAQQADAAVAAQRLAGQVRALGATPVVSPPSAVVGPAGPQGPGPSQQQIDDSVTRYFVDHPPGATPAMVAVQVAAYLMANPPVTQAQITTAAADYLAAHPDLFRGQPGVAGQTGQPGQPGADATDAQVSAAVTAFCVAHNQCAGPAGPAGSQGAQGVSITDLAFQRDQSGACQVVITLHDPATNADTTITHPAGDAACPVTLPVPGHK